MRFEIAAVSYQTDYYLYNLLDSIRRHLPPDSLAAVHVWDNASSDGTLPMLEALSRDMPELRFHVSPRNLGHGPGLDALLRRHCREDWVLLLDSDTQVRRDFLPQLPALFPDPPAFVGQVHPLVPRLYAYLAHLLVHRPTYLCLPPFRQDGAPGVDYFREIERRRLKWTRFRWTDHVVHFGQGTLREIHRRGECGNPLYRFAARHANAESASANQRQREHQLRAALIDFFRCGGRTPATTNRVADATTKAP